MPKEEETRFRVTHPDNTNRVLFSGSEKDARKYLEDNFPRSHGDGFSTNPVFSAQLLSPSGEKSFYHVNHGYGSMDDEGAVTFDSDREDEPPIESAVVPNTVESTVVDEPIVDPNEGVLL